MTLLITVVCTSGTFIDVYIIINKSCTYEGQLLIANLIVVIALSILNDFDKTPLVFNIVPAQQGLIST